MIKFITLNLSVSSSSRNNLQAFLDNLFARPLQAYIAARYGFALGIYFSDFF